MTAYESNVTLDGLAEAIRQAERLVLTTHAKPDGDALGSVVALGRALEHAGKTVERWIMPPIPANLQMLSDGVDIRLRGAPHGNSYGPATSGRDDAADHWPTEPDLAIVLDTGAWSQLEPLRPWLERRREKIAVIDHHLRGDDVGARLYVDAGAAATCELVAGLIDRLGAPFDEAVCEALYVGIASDTGWFRFSNTRAFTHKLAARLMEAGVDHARIYRQLEQTERPQKLKLLTRALDSLQLVAGGRGAVMRLRTTDFEETGALQEETERLVDVPQIVGDVQVVALMTETPEGQVRISFRSKPGSDAVDVNHLAQLFDGGGHARAAGARTDEPLEQVQRELVAAIEQICGEEARSGS